MIAAALNKYINRLKGFLQPKLQALHAKWLQLQPREQRLLLAMTVLLSIVVIFSAVSGVIAYQQKLVKEVSNLNNFTMYSRQAAIRYKNLNKVEANTFNQVDLEQIKGDVAQIFQVDNPDILIQDGQMTINIPNAQFDQVMVLLDQLRRSYAIFPSQVLIARQSRAGFVSFNATFWVKQ